MFSATHKLRSKPVSLVIYCFSYFYHQINFRSALICILFKINKWDKDKWLMDFFIHNVRLYYSFFLSLLCLICRQVAMNIYTRYLCYVFLLIVKRCWVKKQPIEICTKEMISHPSRSLELHIWIGCISFFEVVH